MILSSSVCRAFLFCLLSLVCHSAKAAKWQVTPSATAAYTYSDNIDLSENANNSDVALSLAPGIQVRGEGGRIDLTADYGLQVVRYRDNTQSNDEFHSLDLAANLRLVPDTFLVETSARYGQQPISLTTFPVPQNNIAISRNRTNVFAYQVKPIFKSRLGNAANVQAEYNYEDSQYDNNSIVNQRIRNTQYNLGLSSTEAYRTLSWSLNHNRSDYDAPKKDDYYSITDLTLRYRVTPKLSLIASGGDERNRVTDSQLGEGDTFWSAGFSWKPTSRTFVEITRGDRFFGKTTKASVMRKGKRSLFRLTYDESITTQSSILADTSLIPGFVVLSVVEGFVLEKALHATLKANSAKTEYGLTVDRRDLTYQITNNREEHNAYTVFWDWHISPKSTVSLSGSRQVTDLITSNEEVILDSQRLSFERSIGKSGSGKLSYLHYENKSSITSDDYKSNFYEFSLTWNFR